MQISFSTREYRCEYHHEYHFANIILKTENRARRRRTETERIFALGNSYCDITKSCHSKHSQQFGPSINNRRCQGKTLFSDILMTVAMHNYICQATTSMTSQGFCLVLRDVDVTTVAMARCLCTIISVNETCCQATISMTSQGLSPRSQTC